MEHGEYDAEGVLSNALERYRVQKSCGITTSFDECLDFAMIKPPKSKRKESPDFAVKRQPKGENNKQSLKCLCEIQPFEQRVWKIHWDALIKFNEKCPIHGKK